MSTRYIDPRNQAQTPNRRLRDEIQPLLVQIEKADADRLAEIAPLIKRKLREIYKLARDYETEVSRLRWNELALREATQAQGHLPNNVLPFVRKRP